MGNANHGGDAISRKRKVAEGTLALDRTCHEAYRVHVAHLVDEYIRVRAMPTTHPDRRGLMEAMRARVDEALYAVQASCGGEAQRAVLSMFIEDIHSQITLGADVPQAKRQSLPPTAVLGDIQEREGVNAVTIAAAAPGGLSTHQMDTIASVLRCVPVLNTGLALCDQAGRMRPHLRQLLVDLGRPEMHGNSEKAAIQLEIDPYDQSPIEWMDRARNILLFDEDTYVRYALDQPPEGFEQRRFVCDDRFTITGAELRGLAAGARVAWGSRGDGGGVGLRAYPDTAVVASVNGMPSVDGRNLLQSQLRRDETEYHASQMVRVAGPVHVVFNAHGQTQENCGRPVHCVSIPAMNFQDSESPDRRLLEKSASGLMRVRAPDRPGVLARMRATWFLALDAFARAKVAYPVLCAIGCGRFRRGTEGIVEMWAHALCQVLTRTDHRHSVVLFLSLPTFGAEDNYNPFRTALLRWQHLLPPTLPVVLLHTRSMLAVADYLARNLSLPTGILNPSDSLVVRGGIVGMNWDCGEIALEELIATQTTLFVQHGDVNPGLYHDRVDEVPLDPSVVQTDACPGEPTLLSHSTD